MNWLRNTFEVSHAAHKTLISMEGIRGFAVFLVFLAHYMTLIEPWVLQDSISSKMVAYTHSIGTLGVDLFFVLSGYLIYRTLIRKKTSYKYYISRRIKRIYPTFTAIFIIYLILSTVFPNESKIPLEWKEGALFIVQNFLLMPGLFDITPIITVAWSLSYEFFYYLIIPLLIESMRMRLWKSEYRITFFLFISFLFLFYCSSINGGPIQLLMFISGILLYETIEGKLIKAMPPLGLPALLLAFVLIVALKEQRCNLGWSYALLYVSFYIFCLECLYLQGFTTKLFSFDPIRWLGNMSYSYYLLHALTLKFIAMIFEEIYPSHQSESLLIWLLIIPAFTLTLIPASILFIYIEKPYSLASKAQKIKL